MPTGRPLYDMTLYDMKSNKTQRTYSRIVAIVAQIPPGHVATYGQIAAIVGNCTPRMVGYAMASLPAGSEIPWHRVVNAQGGISPRGDHDGGAMEQAQRLVAEGIRFTDAGRIRLRDYGWTGPDMEWLLAHGYEPAPQWRAE